MKDALWVGLHSPSTDCLNFLTAGALYDFYPHLVDQVVTITQPFLPSRVPVFLFSFGLRTYKVNSSFYRNCPQVCPATWRETTCSRQIRTFKWRPNKCEVLLTGVPLQWRLGRNCSNHSCPKSDITRSHRHNSCKVRLAP